MREFDCTGCGRHIIQYGDNSGELCGHCLALGPRRGKAFQDWQDNTISEEEFKRIFNEEAPQ